MGAGADLTAREVADFAGASRRLVEKAIEEKVFRPRLVGRAQGGRRPRRVLPLHAVAYAAVLSRIDLPLPLSHKKRLAELLAGLSGCELRDARVALAPAVDLDVGQLVGDAVERAERYTDMRDRHLVIERGIKGGTPVIRGTRMTVYAVLGRIEHGESLDDLAADNPDLSREALEAALVYARTHPLLGRPGGRPWEQSAA